MMNSLTYVLALNSFGLIKLVFSSDNTYCNAEKACVNETVDAENIYCRGYEGCAGAHLISEENTYVWGELAGYRANVTCEYNTYCHGLLGCYDSTLEIENDFYTYGYASTAKAELTLGDDMYVRGAFAIYDTTVDGEDDLYMYGYASGLYATIRDFEKIYNYGFLSSYYADIYSGGDNTTFYMYSYGYYSGYETVVYCEAGDTCVIRCDSTGCDGMTIYYSSSSTVRLTCSSTCATCPSTSEYSSLEELQASRELSDREARRNELREWTDQQLKFTDSRKNENYEKSTKKKKTDLKSNNLHRDRKSKNIGYEILKRESIDAVTLFDKQERTLAVINDIGNSNSNYSQKYWRNILFLYGRSFIVTFIAGLLTMISIKLYNKCCHNSEYQKI